MQENMMRDWLKSRKITDAVIKSFDIHGDSHPMIGDCIVIPVLNEDNTFLFNKYRRSPFSEEKPKYIYDKGGKTALYGWHKAKDCPSILITEGEMDCLVAWSHTIPAVTSTGGAMSFQPDWTLQLLGKDITICFDNDEAGAKGMVKTLKTLPWAHVVFLPDRAGIKDISDYVTQGGSLEELLRTRVHFDTVEEVQEHRAKRLSLWQSTFFHDAYIEEHTKPSYVRRETSTEEKSEIEKAKSYPIGELVKVGKNGKASCIWHQDDDPSMHWYKDTNSVYCFSCSKHGDAIDVYRQLHKCSFSDAIKALQ